jgi:hypothetical protein
MLLLFDGFGGAEASEILLGEQGRLLNLGDPFVIAH